MGLTAENLVGALTICSGGEAEGVAVEAGDTDGLAEIVLLLRHDQPTFAPTLLSAWQAEGRELSPALRLELDAARARVGYYRSVDAGLTSKVPGLIPVSGLEIADMYPGGLVRHLTELNYVAAAETDLWHACEHLISDGWELETATFCSSGGGPGVLVSLQRTHEDPYQMPYGVELTTYYSVGSYGASTPLPHLPGRWRGPAIKNILRLLYERYEQPFRARDLVDAVVLHNGLAVDELRALHDAVAALSLDLEYGELVDLVGRTGLGPLPGWPARRLSSATIRVRRMARDASYFLRPLAGVARQLQQRLMNGELGYVQGRAWDAVQQRLSVPSAISGGLLAFGLPLDGPPPAVTKTVLYRRGTLAWADTPIARFLLTIGDYVALGDVEELTDGQADGARTSR
jgi:hypothetical protein